MFVVIFLSTINFLVSSLPQFWMETPLAITVFEVFSITVFTVDYLGRLLAVSEKLRFMIGTCMLKLVCCCMTLCRTAERHRFAGHSAVLYRAYHQCIIEQ